MARRLREVAAMNRGLTTIAGRRAFRGPGGLYPHALREVVEPGLIAIVNVSLEDARVGNPTRDWLANPEVTAAVAAVVGDALADELARARDLRRQLLARLPAGPAGD